MVIMNDADTEEMRKCGVIRIGGRGRRTGDTGETEEKRQRVSESTEQRALNPSRGGLHSLTSKSECITTATFYIKSVLTRPDGLTLTTLPPSFALLSFFASFPILNWSKVVSIHASCMNE